VNGFFYSSDPPGLTLMCWHPSFFFSADSQEVDGWLTLVATLHWKKMEETDEKSRRRRHFPRKSGGVTVSKTNANFFNQI